MEINKQSGLPLQIYIPNLQTMQPFEMEFYTNTTTPKNLNIVVGFDGSKYTDCAPWAKGVYLYTDKKLPNDGELFCRATYYVPSPMVSGGMQKVVVDKIETGITLVPQGGSYFDPIADPSKLKTPSFNDISCSHIPIFMTYYPGAEKGDAGGIDHTLLIEQTVPGEHWIGVDGSKKQVYVRTFVGTTPTEFGYTGNTHLYHWAWEISAGCTLDQCYLLNGWVGTVADGNTDSNTGQIGYNLFAWGNRFGIIVNNNCKAQYLNKPYRLTIKYTKK